MTDLVKAWIFGALFFGVFFFVPGAVVTIIGVRAMIAGNASRTWPVVDGVVRSAELGSHAGNRNGTVYSADVAYDYVVDGVRHTSSRIAVGRWSSSDPSSATEALARYSRGSRVAVHYDPARPSEAVLEPGISAGCYGLVAFGACFMLVGALPAIGWWAGRRRARAAVDTTVASR